MENVVVYKMRTYFREMEIERGSELLYIESVVQKFARSPSKRK
jgi:hypothetical protein